MIAPSSSAKPELTTRTAYQKLCFISSGVEAAEEALSAFTERFGNVSLQNADAVVALGGDGLMLETLRKAMDCNTPVYGMNFGSQGFLMNSPSLPQRLSAHLTHAQLTVIYPLKVDVLDVNGELHSALAINEASLLRASPQAAKIAIYIDHKLRMKEHDIEIPPWPPCLPRSHVSGMQLPAMP